MAGKNRQIVLAARPVGMPKDSDFKLVESEVPAPVGDEVLVRTVYLSVDPYMRGRMMDRESYVAPFKLGEVMAGGVVGKVEKSLSPQFKPGDYVLGMMGFQDYSTAKPEGLTKLDPKLAPLSTALGVLGMPGMTAYFGLLDICDPKPGETVVVSGAAGAVGTLVGQIAKIKGCYVVGIAGADDKIAYITQELGFDAGFNYKTTTNYYAKLKELCPKGIDVYFDNVGGPITDAVFPRLNQRARISVCGQISQYNSAEADTGPRWFSTILVKRAKVQGFLIFDYQRRFGEGVAQMAQWIREGKLKYREQFTEGLESTPRAFIGMMKGENIGKQLVRVSEP